MGYHMALKVSLLQLLPATRGIASHNAAAAIMLKVPSNLTRNHLFPTKVNTFRNILIRTKYFI